MPPIFLLLVLISCILAVPLPVQGEPASFELPKTSEKFFPIGLWGPWPGWYQSTDDYYEYMQSHMPEMASAGFNMINLWVSSNPSPTNLQKVIDTLDAAEANGVYLRPRIHEFARYQDWPARRDNLEIFINAVEEHNALFCYETVDEPELACMATLADLLSMKNWVAQKDAYSRYVWCNQADILQVEASGAFELADPNDTTYPLNTITCNAGNSGCLYPLYAAWATSGNVFSMDIYPVGHPWHESYLKLNAPSEGFKIHRDDIIPLTGLTNPPQGFIIQGCALCKPTMDGDPCELGELTDTPTAHQTRFMAFDVITQGAKSIEWFGHAALDLSGSDITDDIETWEGITTVAGQLAFLHDALAGGATLNPGPSTYTVSPSSLHAICKEYEGNKILIMTNPSDNVAGIDAQITVPGWSTATQVMFEDELITIISETFTDHFDAWDVHLYQNIFVHLDMGTSDEAKGLKHIVYNVPDGDTEPASIGGREARKNIDPATDYYFYFDVSDIFASNGSKSDLYILLDYYDIGTGSLGLEYDADDGMLYKNGGIVTLDNDNQWERHIYHITDAYFGNRQNGGADFRIAKYGGSAFYLDRLEVWADSPLPDQVSSPDPNDLQDDISRTAKLSWNPADKVTSYDVFFGTDNPPAFQGNQTQTIFDPGIMDYLTKYYWRIDAINNYASVTGQVWNFTTESYPGDFDKDLDVDQEDFGFLQACLSGDTRPYQAGCEKADLDPDGDVDLDDFSVFQSCMSGANQPPDPNCAG
ncbi:MAG: hypothetical protein ACYTA5_12030, partial [Planctomycetota bacterium]